MSSAISSKDLWEKFFKSCKLPTDAGKKYAESFVKQRIQSHLLRDLGKEDLRELGIKVLGDQLAIITYVKNCGGSPPEFGGSSKSSTAAIGPRRQVHLTGRVAPVIYNSDEEEEQMQMDDAVDEQKLLSKAPDRHDHYRVIMPEGKLPRTKAILEMHGALKEQGLIKRGSSGIRRSGIEMRRVASQSKAIQKKLAATVVVQDRDITSSTGGIGLGILRSDLISNKTAVVKDANSSQKNRIANRISTSGVPIRVKIDDDIFGSLPQPRQQQISSIRQSQFVQRRNLVTYEDVEDEDDAIMLDEGEEFAQMADDELSTRLPIAKRLQLVGGKTTRPTISFPSNNAQKIVPTSGNRRTRPRVTVGGKTIILGAQHFRRNRTDPFRGGKRKMGTGGGSGSILDRISLT